MERAGILCNDIQFPPQGTECPPIYAMAMRRTQDIWSRLVDGTMYHERSSIQQPHVATVDDLPMMVHLYEIALLDEGEGNTERIDPEGSRVDWIPQRDVSSDALIEAIFACVCGKLVSRC